MGNLPDGGLEHGPELEGTGYGQMICVVVHGSPVLQNGASLTRADGLMRPEQNRLVLERNTYQNQIDAFKLWEYLMTTKHGLTVGEPGLCLWIADLVQQLRRHGADRDLAAGACVLADVIFFRGSSQAGVSATMRVIIDV